MNFQFGVLSRKKGFVLVVIGVLLCLAGAIQAYSNEPLDKHVRVSDQININGEKISGVSQIIGIGEVGVPVRAIAEKLGYSVRWDKAQKQVSLTKGNELMILTIGKLDVLKNGEKREIYSAPMLINGASYIAAPISAQLFGYEYLITDDVMNITSK